VYLVEAMALISDNVKILTDWALAILGGSIITILSASYLRPKSIYARLSYLLFLPAWCFIGLSMHYGSKIPLRVIAGEISPNLAGEIASKINSDFSDQQKFLSYGLGLLMAWLVIYLLWWIFHNEAKE
jgi:hypothetical protein